MPLLLEKSRKLLEEVRRLVGKGSPACVGSMSLQRKHKLEALVAALEQSELVDQKIIGWGMQRFAAYVLLHGVVLPRDLDQVPGICRELSLLGMELMGMTASDGLIAISDKDFT